MRYLFKGGFTLIELIVVLLVAGIALSIVSLSLGRAYKKSVIKEQAARLTGTLRYARDTSLLKRVPVTFALDAEEGTYWLEKNETIASGPRRVPDGVSLAGTEIVFLPKGNSTGGWVELAQPNGKGFRIEVDPVTGNAEIKRF